MNGHGSFCRCKYVQIKKIVFWHLRNTGRRHNHENVSLSVFPVGSRSRSNRGRRGKMTVFHVNLKCVCLKLCDEDNFYLFIAM